MASRHHKQKQVYMLCSLKTAKAKDFASRRKPQSAIFQNGGGGHTRFHNGIGHTRFQNGATIENLFLTIKFRMLSEIATQCLQSR